ncbi:hypothetical protein AX14_008654 [Amanita brunnescens Koide BX004]|nr:hypothetical protein AX14_008654 [Amanita brunnescens Koide BX004]
MTSLPTHCRPIRYQHHSLPHSTASDAADTSCCWQTLQRGSVAPAVSLPLHQPRLGPEPSLSRPEEDGSASPCYPPTGPRQAPTSRTCVRVDVKTEEIVLGQTNENAGLNGRAATAAADFPD